MNAVVVRLRTMTISFWAGAFFGEVAAGPFARGHRSGSFSYGRTRDGSTASVLFGSRGKGYILPYGPTSNE